MYCNVSVMFLHCLTLFYGVIELKMAVNLCKSCVSEGGWLTMFYVVCAVFFTLFDVVWIPEVEDQGDQRERTHFLLFTSFTENIVFYDVCVERITVFLRH